MRELPQGGPAEFYARDRQVWRDWLEKNHASGKNIWLILHNKNSTTPGVRYEEAVEEAIGFGWIDSLPRKRDDQSHLLRFSKRNPRSKWSRRNRERAERMIAAGLMTDAGMRSIETAKESGTWTALEGVQSNEIPPDLKQALETNPTARDYFELFPPSSKRGILEWILSAKKEETRQKRIEETVRLAEKNVRAHHYRQ